MDTIAKLYLRTFGEEPVEDLAQEIYQRKTALFRSYNSETRLIPTPVVLMQYLQSKEVEMAVVTGSTEGNAYPRIARHYADFIHESHHHGGECPRRGSLIGLTLWAWSYLGQSLSGLS